MATSIEEFAQLTQGIGDIFTMVAATVGGVWAYLKFEKYEKRWLAADTESAIEVKLEVKVLPAENPSECVLAFTAVINNNGKVNSYVDLDKSWFVVETITGMIPTEKAKVVNIHDNKPVYADNSLLSISTKPILVKMENSNLWVVRIGTSMSQSSVCIMKKGLFRVSVEFAVSSRDKKVFEGQTQAKVPPAQRIVWSSSTIVDGRDLTQHLTKSPKI